MPQAARRRVRQNGTAIRALRQKDGWTQEDLANAAGLTQKALSSIELEVASARITNLNKIARRLRVPVDAIMRDHADAEAGPGPDGDPELADVA